MTKGSYLETEDNVVKTEARDKLSNTFGTSFVTAEIFAKEGSLVVYGYLSLDCAEYASCSADNIETDIKSNVLTINGFDVDIVAVRVNGDTEDNCDPDPCNGNATACYSQASNGFSCQCKFQYEGADCAQSKNFCADVTCENQGTCTNNDPATAVEGQPGYTCACVDGYVGINCETNKDDCIDDELNARCKPGNCTDGLNTHTCACPAGVADDPAIDLDDCLLDVNECEPKPCGNNGECKESRQGLAPGVYECTCNNGYKGDNCGLEEDPCDAIDACLNGGTCTKVSNLEHTCTCKDGFIGDNCNEVDPESAAAANNEDQCGASKEVSICAEKSGNGGVGVQECYDLIDGNDATDYRCECNADYYGDHCENYKNKPLFAYRKNDAATSDLVWLTPGSDTSLKVKIGGACITVFNGCYNEFFIADNGLLTFGGELDITPTMQRQTFPYASSPNKDIGIVAAAFVDLKGEGDAPGATTGIVYYNVLQDLYSGGEKNGEFERMKGLIVPNLPVDLIPTHIIIVTWYDFVHNDDVADASNTERMRFQTAIVSDAESQQSFAIFNYEESSLKNKNWAIGAQSGSGAKNINLGPINAEQDVFEWAKIGNFDDVRNEAGVHLPDYNGRIVLTLTETVDTADVYKAQFHCLQWAERQVEGKAEKAANAKLANVNCPCYSGSINGQFPNLGSTIWSGGSQPAQFYDGSRVNCFISKKKNKQSTEECCYDANGQLKIDPLKFGTGSRYANFPTDPSWYDNDGKPKEDCFKAGRPEVYYKHRPINDCSKFKPTKIAASNGDPHITTIDGKTYTMNGIGEFVLMDTIDDSNGYSVQLQARFEQVFKDKNAVEDEKKFGRGSQYTGLAMLETNDGTESHFQFVLTNDRTDITIKTGNEDITTTFKATADNGIIKHSSGEATLKRLSASSIEYSSEILTLTISANMDIDGAPISVTVGPIPSTFESVGLFGRYNKGVTDSADDFYARYTTSEAGTATGTDPINHRGFVLMKQAFSLSTTEAEYLTYAKTWRVASGASQFRELDSESEPYRQAKYLNFQPVFWEDILADANLKTYADACAVECTSSSCDISQVKKNCIVDGFLSENTAFGKATEVTSTKQEQEVEEAANTAPTLSVENIIKVVLNQETTISVNTSDADGDTVTVKVDGTSELTGASAAYNDKTEVITLNITDKDANVNSLSAKATDGKASSPTVDMNVLLCACENGGDCVYEGFDPSLRFQVVACDCSNAVGYTGAFCENDIDGCAPEPCGELTPGVKRNCTDKTAAEQQSTGEKFACSPCADNYIEQGTKCIDINECKPQDAASKFKYTPENCDQTCENIPGSFKCRCWDGFRPLDQASATCGNVDECETGVAQCQQICNDLTPASNGDIGFNCTCRAGNTLNADNTTCTPEQSLIDDCLALNCSSCGYGTDGTTPKCFCPIGKELAEDNRTCDPINECTSGAHQCQVNTGAYCQDKDVRYECRCNTGYVLNADKFSCSPCPQGTWGDGCAKTCLNCMGGTCDPASGCSSCLPGFVNPNGTRDGECTININECNSTEVASLGVQNADCPAESTCIDNVGSYTCMCNTGYVKSADGSTCEIRQNCGSSTCENGGVCGAPVLNDFQCNCANGYTGKQCLTNINECSTDPCQNNATCVDKIADYSCTCPTGWAGKNCSEDVDECLQEPCLGGGTCTTPGTIGTFQCACVSGLSGDRCEIGGPTADASVDAVYVVAYSDAVGSDLIAALPNLVRGALNSEFNKSVTAVQATNARNHNSNSHTLVTITLTYYQSCSACSGTAAAAEFKTEITQAAGHTALAYFATGDTNRCTADTPCQNNAHCFSGITNYLCVCTGAFTGTNCEVSGSDEATTAGGAEVTTTEVTTTEVTTPEVTTTEVTTQSTVAPTIVAAPGNRVFFVKFTIRLAIPCKRNYELSSTQEYKDLVTSISFKFNFAMRRRNKLFIGSVSWKFKCASFARGKRDVENDVSVQTDAIYEDGDTVSPDTFKNDVISALAQDNILGELEEVESVNPNSIQSLETFSHIESKNEDDNQLIAIIVGTVVGVLALGLIVVIMYYCITKERSRRRFDDATTQFSAKTNGWGRGYAQHPSPAFMHWQNDHQRGIPAANMPVDYAQLQQQWLQPAAPPQTTSRPVDWSVLRNFYRAQNKMNHNGIIHRQQTNYQKNSNGYYWVNN